MTDALQVGQVIELNDGRIATVRFVGETSFAGGDWVGVEFEDATGKNDGSVQGQRYFECDAGHGMFLRPTGVGKILDDPTPKAKPGGAVKPSNKSRPSSVVSRNAQRPGSTDPSAARRQTLNSASPTPSARPVPGANGQRTSRFPSTLSSSSNASSRGATPPMNGRAVTAKTATSSRLNTSNSDGRRTAATPSSAAARRVPQSFAPAAPTSTRKPTPGQPAARQPQPRISLAARAGMPRSAADTNGTPKQEKERKQSSPVSSAPGDRSATSNDDDDDDNKTSPGDEVEGIDNGELNGHVKTKPATATSIEPKPLARAATSSRQIEDLESRLKMMEKQRSDDKEKLKALERLQAERDRFEGIIQRLQTKFQPQQQELAELRRQLQESEKKLSEVESKEGEHESLLEMAALDREMAEETAEALRVELEALQAKAEELELEVEVLRDENEEYGKEFSPEDRSNQGWLQLERSNEKLKEALLRLRDMTQSKEAELNDQISSLEEDLRELDGIKQQYEETQENLRQSESAVEDLRQQLDAVLGSEDMVEELADKNLALNEQIEDLKLTIEDLENLKELNDELELNHIEAEKQLQEELDFKDSILGEHTRRVIQQDEKISDYEYTIGKFRELVISLQAHLEDMKASQEITEAEAEGLGQRSKAMADLNMKLQTSVANTQIKTVDLELRRLEAQEAVEHLSIVQLFLPDAFHAERDSVLSLLRFKRIAFKSRLLQGFLKEQVSSATSQLQDEVFTVCDIIDKLGWISASCDRFVGNIRGCTLEQFASYEGALYDLDPVERALNGYIEVWKRGEFKERQVAEELQRSISLLTHLAGVHIQDTLESYADDIIMRTTLMQSQLENVGLILTLTRFFVESSVMTSPDDEEHELDDFARKADALISQSRSAKVVAGKTHSALTELKLRSMTFVTDTRPYFETAQDAISDLSTFAHRISDNLQKALLEESGGTANSLSGGSILALLQRITHEVFPSTHDSSPLPSLATKCRTATDHLQQLASLTADLSKTAEFEQQPPPWVLRSQELKSTKLTAVDTEAELARLRDEMRDKATALRLRDQTLEEQSVKVELLESRMRDATAKAARIAELEKALSSGKKREKEILEALEKQIRLTTELRVERDRWKQAADDHTPAEGVDAVAKPSQETAVVSSREVDDLKRQIRGLHGAVRYLRDDNRRIRLTEPLGTEQSSWLQQPLLHKRSKEEEEKDRLLSEGSGVFAALLELGCNAQIVDLSKLPENKLAWRPMKEKTAWRVAKQREDWESWASWQKSVASRAREALSWRD